MTPKQKSKLYLVGTYEGVAEAVMYSLRAGNLQGHSSEGIKEIGIEAPGLYIFESNFERVKVGALSFCYDLSTMFPTIVAGTTLLGFQSDSVDKFKWNVKAYLDGVAVMDVHDGHQTSAMLMDIPMEIRDSQSNGYLPIALFPKVDKFVCQIIVAESRSRLSSVKGYRWSSFTTDVGLHGLKALSNGPGQLMSAISASKMISESTSCNVVNDASWVDTLFFGHRTDSKHIPFSDAEVEAWPKRHLELLRLIGGDEMDENDVARLLLNTLSSPLVNLQGLHPLIFLVNVNIPVEDELAALGLRKLINKVGMPEQKGEYTEDHRIQIVNSVIKSEYKSESLRLAMRMGISPGRLASWLIPAGLRPEQEKIGITAKLIAGFREIFGTIKDFPEELRRAFEDGGDVISKVFESIKNQESMSKVIGDSVCGKRADGQKLSRRSLSL